MTLDQRTIEQQIDDLENLAKSLDAQIEQTEWARDQARRQIEVLKEAIDKQR